jgi:hypothetical protein
MRLIRVVAIQSKRSKVFSKAIGNLFDWCAHYANPSYICKVSLEYSFECGSIMEGALRRNMNHLGVVSRDPGKDYPVDLSIEDLCNGVVDFRDPVWRSGRSGSHQCNFRDLKMGFQFHKSTLELKDIDDKMG